MTLIIMIEQDFLNYHRKSFARRFTIISVHHIPSRHLRSIAFDG
jgi:hypothetical protein